MDKEFEIWADKVFEDMCISLKIPEHIARQPIRGESIVQHLIQNQYSYLFKGNCTVKRLKPKPSKSKHVNREFKSFCNAELGKVWSHKRKVELECINCESNENILPNGYCAQCDWDEAN